MVPFNLRGPELLVLLFLIAIVVGVDEFGAVELGYSVA